jgi:hypothetical protein
MRLQLFRIAFLMALPLFTGAASDAALDRATLRGLKGVNIVIDPLSPALQDAGVTANLLDTHISARLERAGIPVDRKAVEFLGFRITEVRGKRGPYALSLRAGVYQPVLLVRDHNVKTATQTWDVETVLLSEPKTLNDAVLTSVDELVDGFAAAWRSVNQ